MDAAMGTRLIAKGLSLDDPSDCSAIWNLTHPDDVAAIHALDIAADADVLLTNTFLANRIWLEPRGYGDRVKAINRRAASIARGAAGPTDRRRLNRTYRERRCERCGLSRAGRSVSRGRSRRTPPGNAYAESGRRGVDQSLTRSTPRAGQLHSWSPGEYSRIREKFRVARRFGHRCQLCCRDEWVIASCRRVAEVYELPLLFRPSIIPLGLGEQTEDESFAAFVSSVPML